MTHSPDVVVVGAGVIGWSIARELAQHGIRTVVVGDDAAGIATSAAGGMLAPLAESRQPGPFLDLGLASAASRFATLRRSPYCRKPVTRPVSRWTMGKP